jgi:beta-lactamase class C
LQAQSRGTTQALDFSPVESKIAEEMASRRIPGVAVAVVHRDRIIFQKALGVSHTETSEPLRLDMSFQIASATKMFTAATLATLVARGKLDLTAPVGKYLDGLAAEVAKVNTHQLLSHTSGLKQGWPTGRLPDASASLPDSARLLTADSFFDEPGRTFSYSNPGFTLAGALIEVASGRSYAAAVSETLFNALKMHKTSFGPDAAKTRLFSHGHMPGPQPKVIRPDTGTPLWLTPGTGMTSTVSDLAQFTIAFINNGDFANTRVLPSAVIRRLSTPYVPFLGYLGHYGYGLRVYDRRGLRVVEHAGLSAGFGSMVYMVPRQRFSMIILANLTAAGRLYSVVDTALDVVLSPSKPPEKNPFEEQEGLPITTEEATRYAGLYANTNTIELLTRGTQLIYRSGSLDLPVTKTREHFFYVRPPGGAAPPMPFVLVFRADGTPEYLYTSQMVAHKRIAAASSA